ASEDSSCGRTCFRRRERRSRGRGSSGRAAQRARRPDRVRRGDPPFGPIPPSSVLPRTYPLLILHSPDPNVKPFTLTLERSAGGRCPRDYRGRRLPSRLSARVKREIARLSPIDSTNAARNAMYHGADVNASSERAVARITTA